MKTSQIISELKNQGFTWSKDQSDEVQSGLESGWIDFNMTNKCPYTLDPSNIKVWDNDGDEIDCTEEELDVIYETIVSNTEIV